jgi:tRNA (Thr-GGU) A37 N-methylase
LGTGRLSCGWFYTRVEELIIKKQGINGTLVIDIKPVFREFLPQREVSQPEWSKKLMKNYWDEKP